VVDARDLKSLVAQATCRFESGPRHSVFPDFPLEMGNLDCPSCLIIYIHSLAGLIFFCIPVAHGNCFSGGVALTSVNLSSPPEIILLLDAPEELAVPRPRLPLTVRVFANDITESALA
jgi:hypothetical protein